MSEQKPRRRQPPPLPPRHSNRKLFIGLGAAGLVVLVLGVLLVTRPPQPPKGTETFEVASREHVSGVVAYPQNPPVGGDHAPEWQNCGFYSSAIRNETAVHSMEHGAVWITYKPDLQNDQINRIRQLANGQTYVLASQYPDLPAPVVLSAWGRQLKADSAEDPRVDQFILAFRNGPTAPEKGASCLGGVGNPR